MTGSTTSPDGLEIRFETAGTGDPAIVFVHGWSCDRTYWRGQMPAFADRHRVVAVDLAGHGESGIGRTSWTMPAFGGDVATVVDTLGLDRVVLVGHSMGGDVIVEAERLLRGRVAGLVWVDVYRTLEDPGSPEELETILEPFQRDFASSVGPFIRAMFLPTTPRDLMDWVVADMSAAPPEIAIDAMRHAVGNDGPVVGRLRELRVPIVAINPDDRPTDEESLARYGIRTVLMPNADHFLMLAEPDRFNRLLSEVVDSFDGPPSG
jgi:pimeloyl-ACP methyl ester carboxylesterase